MAKDFSTATQLPDDFLHFDFQKADLMDGIYEKVEEEQGFEAIEKLSAAVWTYGFDLNSNMVGTKEAIEAEATRTFKEKCEEYGVDPAGFKIEADSPEHITISRNGEEIGECYSIMGVNDKYMDYDDPERELYPIIPTTSGYQELGCSWIDYGDPTWDDFKKVEEALEQNQFAADVGNISEPDNSLNQ